MSTGFVRMLGCWLVALLIAKSLKPRKRGDIKYSEAIDAKEVSTFRH